MSNQKAWLVRVKDEFSAEIIFAETSGQAKSLALSCDFCEDAEFTDLEVRRAPYADKYYKPNKWHLDWDNPRDRVALVKDCGFVCGEDMTESCEECSASQYCDIFNERQAEECL